MGQAEIGRLKKEEFSKLHDILCALNTALKYPNNVSKHNKVKATIKDSDLSKYWNRNPATEPLFRFAERAEDWDFEDALPNSFVKRAAGWIRMARLTYTRLQKACLEEAG